MPLAAADLRARVESLPGMERLLPALAGLPPAYLVGGAVRDLLRRSAGVDVDVAVEGDAPAVARELAERLGGEVEEHERFGTARVRAGDLAVDIATARRERYRSPGALPAVEPATIESDLGRRDFSINAMALVLAEEERGRLLDPHGGRDDLEHGIVRVLHRHSFVDDPTRVLRAARYEARLGFAMDPDTDALARAAVAAGALDTVSGRRVAAELLLLLGEESRHGALARLADLGVDRALDRALAFDPELAAGAAREAELTGADPSLAALAALVQRDVEELRGWIERFGLEASDRDRVLRAARAAPSLAAALAGEAPREVEGTPGSVPTPSELHRLLSGEPPEALALALALGAPSQAIALYLDRLAGARLEIGGDDLLAAGVPPSPALGQALEETLRRKLDGQVAGRDAELRCALALARGQDDAAGEATGGRS